MHNNWPAAVMCLGACHHLSYIKPFPQGQTICYVSSYKRNEPAHGSRAISSYHFSCALKSTFLTLSSTSTTLPTSATNSGMPALASTSAADVVTRTFSAVDAAERRAKTCSRRLLRTKVATCSVKMSAHSHSAL